MFQVVIHVTAARAEGGWSVTVTVKREEKQTHPHFLLLMLCPYFLPSFFYSSGLRNGAAHGELDLPISTNNQEHPLQICLWASVV